MADKPNTMKAIVIESFGGAEQLKIRQLPIPVPKPDEVQINVICTAVNPVDWKIRNGLLQQRIPHHFPLIPGWDAAGTVSALGSNVKNFKIGDAVFAYCRKPIVQWGTYSEYICYSSENIAHMPTNLSFAQAAAIPLAGLTAWQSLFQAANLKKGESILIQAGAGGVGSLAIQFAKYAEAFVITTASQSNHAYVKSLGADLAIDYRTQSIEEEVKKVALKGLDVVFDTLGGQSLKDSFSFLKSGGRLVSIVEPPNQTLAEHFKIQSFFVFVSPNGKQLQEIANLIQAGQVRPIHIQEMSLDQAADAQEKNRKGHVQGKIVLRIREESV